MQKKSLGIAIALLVSSMVALRLLNETGSDGRRTAARETRTSPKTNRSPAAAEAASESRATFDQGTQARKASNAVADPIDELAKSSPRHPMPSPEQAWLSFEFERWSYICARHRLAMATAEEVRILLKEDGLPEGTRKRYERFVADTDEMQDSTGPKVVCAFL